MTMMANDNFNNYTRTITTEERIIINVKYLAWLYAKSKERKKQTNDVFDAERAIELVVRDTGGEKAVKELFLKEQDEKIINELVSSNPTIAETFGQL
jgi:exopolysaccharide biosynthesis predicted pyruvyltransferase EpsI